MKRPPAGVRTPDALFTAVRVKEPVTGMERTKEPIILPIPKAIISCVASTAFPLAERKLICQNITFQSLHIIFNFLFQIF